MVGSGKDWLIRQMGVQIDDQSRRFKCIAYFMNPDLDYYATYMRVGANGTWQLLAQPNTTPLYYGVYYQVVVFWNDRRKDPADAPLPPHFDWSKVAKPTL